MYMFIHCISNQLNKIIRLLLLLCIHHLNQIIDVYYYYFIFFELKTLIFLYFDLDIFMSYNNKINSLLN